MKQSFRICLAWSVVLVGLNTHVTGSVDDWPKFRGHTEQGISTAKNVPTFWSREKNIVWKSEIPHRGWSSPF